MGYDLHITRAPGHWASNEGFEIAVEEWMRVVENDAELSHASNDGGYLAYWGDAVRCPHSWFDWSRGNIGTKNPDGPIIQKMLSIAELLHARVQGDDGEIYLPEGKVERDGAILEGPDWDWRSY